MPFITAGDGTRLFWCEWGEGRPMLFLNSLGCGTSQWDYQFAAFAERGFRCIGFDRRGHGRSDRPARGYDQDSFADDVATLIETLGLDGLTVVTHSMAGGEAVRTLSRHGSRRVSRLVLLAPMTPALLQTEGNPGGAPRGMFEALWQRWRHDYPGWVAEATPAFFVPETLEAMRRWAATMLQVSVPVALACARSMVEADFRDEMRRIEVPTLLIHGDQDVSAPIELTGRPSAKLIPGVRYLEYAGAPHGLMFTHMDRLHADIMEFVANT